MTGSVSVERDLSGTFLITIVAASALFLSSKLSDRNLNLYFSSRI
ncbi:10595_t:CDS:2 [Funneliformis mosseae]|uniref:10595_t:CDS:1 n=1 Tax=Funneliformis mosseae TaxID=27381 RepID=A0A9N9HCL2_FUNMO|nr:10595_t:CDS:2 [Funneliformis mosseae]